MRINAIAAICSVNNGIGYRGYLPWPRHRADLENFKTVTSQVSDERKINAVVMGRKTWTSISKRALDGRINIIVSTTMPQRCTRNVIVVDSFESLMKQLEILEDRVETVWAIGGTAIYEWALSLPNFGTLHATFIDKYYKCDTFFPTHLLHPDPSVAQEMIQNGPGDANVLDRSNEDCILNKLNVNIDDPNEKYNINRVWRVTSFDKMSDGSFHPTTKFIRYFDIKTIII
jgi:dihydrofolate reductase